VKEGPFNEPEASGSWHGISSPSRSDSSPVPASAPTPSKYVPPHLRAALLEEKALGNKQKAEERQKLERKAQGLLNK
jgi:nucleolar MIF4G domain-containing protein 1